VVFTRRLGERVAAGFLAIGLAAGAMLDATCASPTLPSQTTITPPPAITCPAAPSPVTTSNGQSATVSYASPAVTGGTPPVSVTCTPSSGSAFNVGATAVTCTATDAVRRSASCSFTVSVILPLPRLGVTTILAFGDSITEGEVPMPGEFALEPAGFVGSRFQLRIRPHVVEPDESYPADLTTMLAQRYTAQGASRIDAFTLGAGNTTDCTTDPPRPATSGIVVINAGCLGEQAEAATTLARLNNKIATYRPDVVLLLEGANDLDPLEPAASIAAGVQGVQTLISAARGLGARVLVGTLLPEIASDVNGGAASLIVPFNNQLVPVAASTGATVVDLYSDIVTDVTDWIAYDGLHPTVAGYQEMARVWFNSVRSSFEQPSTSALTKGGGQVRPNTALRTVH
jgi:lysophospholipase L1-like esterase